MVSYDWDNGGYVGAFFRLGVVSCLRRRAGAGVSAILRNEYGIRGQNCVGML